MSSFVRQFPMTTPIASSQFFRELIVLGLVLANSLPQCVGATTQTASRHSGSSGAVASTLDANNGGSSAATQSKLGVYMVRSPESTVAPQGDEVQFECELNLEPERLEWRFRPLDSLGDKDDYIYLHKNHSYNVTNKDGTSKLRVYVNQKSVGEYQCIAWFGASSLASIPAKLMLATISLDNNYNDNFSNDRPMTMRRISSPPQSVHWKISPGNSIILKCGNVISYPPPVWSFFKDNNPVSSTIPQLQTGGLILTQLSSKDSGTYWCSAVNSITGTELKIPQKTTILVDTTPKTAPIFLTIPSTMVTVKPGSTALLECAGIGNPVPKAVWSRPDASIHNNRTTDLGYGLQIVDVKHHDQGNYICQLDNGIAPALNHQIRLIVLDAPEIIEPPRATLTNENDVLELHCVAKGSPKPDVYWMINGYDTRWDPLIDSNGSTLTIKSVEKKHAGIVQCFARNTVGEVSGSNLLQVNPKQISGSAMQPLGSVPQSTKMNSEHGKTRQRKKHKHPIMIPPSRPSITRLSDESVMVRWSVPPNDGLPIQFFKVQYRMLANPNKGKTSRSQWMTANEDIAPHVCSYEVNNLKPDHYYRFRIAAVYSNNDNKLGNTSGKFHLQRGAQLGPAKSSLVAPTLTRIEPAAETAIIIHWEFPQQPPNPVDGFYAYYRASTSAGEYAKATVDGMGARHFKIDHLEPGTAYEFKLQSFTASAASDFSAILTGKTLKPPTPPPIIPTVIAASESAQHSNSLMPFIAGAAGLLAVVLLVLILLCVAIKRRKNNREDDITENKSHPDHIQADSNGFAGSNGRVIGASPMHKSSRLNGVVSRMNITPNPLAQDGDKNRVELRFLPNNNCPPSPHPEAMMPPLPHRRTLERSFRNLPTNNTTTTTTTATATTTTTLHVDTTQMIIDGDLGIPIVKSSSIRRTRKGSISVPGSPRVNSRGPSTELLHHNRSPMPIRAGVKRSTRLGRAENMSSGSLNSIEV